jgi:hypothetical protein
LEQDGGFVAKSDQEKQVDYQPREPGRVAGHSTSLAAKEAQAQLVAITHNLLLIYEQTLETEHGVTNQAEDLRRAERIETAAKKCAEAGRTLSALVLRARRATQRSVKFVRWARQSIRDRVAETVAVLRLKALYATL